MVPTWPGAIEAALYNLKPGGQLLIVDFWDQKDLPTVFAAGLKKWLSLFHVHYRPEVHDALVELGRSGRADVSLNRSLAAMPTSRRSRSGNCHVYGRRNTRPVTVAASTAKPRMLIGTAGTVHGAQLPGR